VSHISSGALYAKPGWRLPAVSAAIDRRLVMPTATTEPQLLAVQQLDNAVRIQLRVQPELSWFVGHFPGVPILPGVVQTTWAIDFGRRYLPVPAQFRYLSNMKFMRFILPDARLELRLQYLPAKSELHFEYHDGVATCASGRIGFAAESER
jgi:3-hydroxymyristoyl/3-hydroxydecanoyl-(acyl carrier protein) dehydratase